MTVRASFGISNGLAPAQGPKGLSLNLDFSAAVTIRGDFLLEETQGIIQGIQSVFVDNSQNASAVTITFGVTQQRLVIPANSQLTAPVFAVDQLSFTATSVGAVIVPVTFLNVPMPFASWGSVTVNSTLVPTTGVYTDRSGSIAVGNTSQQAMAANGARKRLIIQNPATETEVLYVNFTAAANSATKISLELVPGGSYDSAFGPVTTEAVNVVAVTAAHKYIAKEM